MSEAVKHATLWVGSSLIATLLLTGFGAGEAKRYSGKIAFTMLNNSTTGLQGDLFVIGADGTRMRQLTSNAKDEHGPSWSPDGKSIAFVAATFFDSGQAESTITVVAADGSKRRVLLRTQSGQLAFQEPAWSPNGQRIAFTWLRNTTQGLWLLRMDGSVDPVTSETVQHPSWAPDGKRLAYATSGGIFVVNVKTRKTRLVNGTAESGCPVWSPNGKWIAVCASRAAAGFHRANSIDIVSSTGATRRRVLTGGVIYPVAWSPGSDAILFVRNKDPAKFADTQLFIVSLRDHRVTAVPGTEGGGTASWHR
jgi:Tol biopolymer transport system component